MNGRTFVKVFKDSKLIDNKLSTTSIDIIFAKIKTKGKLKINFKQFKNGLVEAAKVKKCDYELLSHKIALSKGPKFKGTKAMYTKLHDDKSQYTGVYAKGGPSKLMKNKVQDLKYLANRGKANVRGVNDEIMKLTDEH